MRWQDRVWGVWLAGLAAPVLIATWLPATTGDSIARGMLCGQTSSANPEDACPRLLSRPSSPVIACVGTVPPFGRCTINVNFAPARAGPQPGTLVIADGFSSALRGPQSVQLYGAGSLGGANPPPTLAPLIVSFGPQPLGTASSPKTLTLTNNQRVPLAVPSITITNGSFTESDNCVPAVAPYGRCTISVTFVPLAGGALSGALVVNDGFTNSPLSPQASELLGVGATSPSPTAAPTPISSGSPYYTITPTPDPTPTPTAIVASTPTPSARQPREHHPSTHSRIHR